MKIRNIIIIITLSSLALGFTAYKTKLPEKIRNSFNGSDEKNTNSSEVEVKKGYFEVVIAATGELQSSKSITIPMPSNLRDVEIWNVKIAALVPEGTIVDAGEYVGALDKTEINKKLEEIQKQLDDINRNLVTQRLDTTVDMKEERNKIMSLKDGVSEAEIKYKESVYEPLAVVRQAQIDWENAKRSLQQAQRTYTVKERKGKRQMQRYQQQKDFYEQRKAKIMSVMETFTIKAPAAGMVVYFRFPWGEKIQVGSQVNTWNPILATLPDLSSLVSKTYVNETDINKVKVGQKVRVKVDAFPKKEFSGVIKYIANVGEILPNTTTKVFETQIEIVDKNDDLRPTMTTSNTIIISTYKDVVFVPLESIHGDDSITYVFKKGFSTKKQIIKTGASNENNIIVESGLQAGDKVLLTIPEDEKTMKFADK